MALLDDTLEFQGFGSTDIKTVQDIETRVPEELQSGYTKMFENIESEKESVASLSLLSMENKKMPGKTVLDMIYHGIDSGKSIDTILNKFRTDTKNGSPETFTDKNLTGNQFADALKEEFEIVQSLQYITRAGKWVDGSLPPAIIGRDALDLDDQAKAYSIEMSNQRARAYEDQFTIDDDLAMLNSTLFSLVDEKNIPNMTAVGIDTTIPWLYDPSAVNKGDLSSWNQKYWDADEGIFKVDEWVADVWEYMAPDSYYPGMAGGVVDALNVLSSFPTVGKTYGGAISPGYYDYGSANTFSPDDFNHDYQKQGFLGSHGSTESNFMVRLKELNPNMNYDQRIEYWNRMVISLRSNNISRYAVNAVGETNVMGGAAGSFSHVSGFHDVYPLQFAGDATADDALHNSPTNNDYIPSKAISGTDYITPYQDKTGYKHTITHYLNDIIAPSITLKQVKTF